jgi:hypothetical protein
LRHERDGAGAFIHSGNLSAAQCSRTASLQNLNISSCSFLLPLFILAFFQICIVAPDIDAVTIGEPELQHITKMIGQRGLGCMLEFNATNTV